MKTKLLSGLKEVALKEICIVKKGQSITRKDILPGKVPVIAGGQHPAYYHNKANYADKTITVSASGAYAGFVNYFEIPIFASDCSAIVAKSNEILLKYVYYMLKYQQKIIYDFQRGGGQPHVYPKDLMDLKLKLPTFSTQKEIVSILEKAEKVKELRKEVDELTKDFLKSVFLEMFSQGLSKESDHISLEDITTRITDGEHATPRRDVKGIYLLSARNILNHQISLEDVDFIDEEEFKKISKRIVPQIGDVLVSCSGSVGRVARVKDDYRFQLVRSVALIRPDIEKLNPIYLEYFFETNYMQMQISKSINQSSQANLFQGKIKRLKIYLPSIELQNKFASIVKEIEKITNHQKQSKEQIHNLYNNLIQKVFKGELIC